MMILTHNNNRYHVRFRYRVGKKRTLSGVNVNKRNVTTECIISKRENDQHVVLGVGSSIRDKRDPFIKDVGRKIALGRALASMDERNETVRNILSKQQHNENLTQGEIDILEARRQFREFVWQQYGLSHKSNVAVEILQKA